MAAIQHTVERALASHQEERLMSTPTFAIRCLCGWQAEDAAFTGRRASFRRHVAEAVVAALDSGSCPGGPGE